jgi:predicted SAM-dependent methyltransferase
MLKPGGVLRIVMPDASKYIHSYVDPGNEFINSWRPGRLTAMIALQEEFYGFGHRALYDSATVHLFCRTAGFSLVESKKFGDSRIVPCPDCEWRIPDSFYTEAVK